MALLFDADISGDGIVDLGDAKVQYALFRGDAIGWETRTVDDGDNSDRVLRMGFLTFGFKGDAGDGVERYYWQPPIWLDWHNTEWIPVQSFAGDGFQYARALRWGLSVDVLGHLWVNGN